MQLAHSILLPAIYTLLSHCGCIFRLLCRDPIGCHGLLLVLLSVLIEPSNNHPEAPLVEQLPESFLNLSEGCCIHRGSTKSWLDGWIISKNLRQYATRINDMAIYFSSRKTGAPTPPLCHYGPTSPIWKGFLQKSPRGILHQTSRNLEIASRVSWSTCDWTSGTLTWWFSAPKITIRIKKYMLWYTSELLTLSFSSSIALPTASQDQIFAPLKDLQELPAANCREFTMPQQELCNSRRLGLPTSDSACWLWK